MNMKYALIPLLFLAGCASYKASSLTSLDSEVVLTSPQGELVAVAKAFDRIECKRYLDRDVLRAGYQPVQLVIQNNSDKDYVLSLDRISLPVARPEEVAERVHTSTVGRAVGYGVAGLLIWPFFIPAVVDGFKSAEANESLDNDFAAKAAKDRTIGAYSRMNGLLFVPVRGYKNDFTVTLIDVATKEPKTLNLQVKN